jgi:integrase
MLRELIDAYGKHNEQRLRTWPHMRKTIETVFAVQSNPPANVLTISLLQRTIDAHRARSTAHRAIGYLRPVLQWGRMREITDLDGSLLELPKGTNVRCQRVFSDDELHAVLHALRERTHPADDIAMLLLLTGCRRQEIAALEWGEVGADRITIPQHAISPPPVSSYRSRDQTGPITKTPRNPNPSNRLLRRSNHF